MIPLSNLVEIHERWWKITGDREIESPIGKTLYEYIRVHGDKVERGEIPDFTAEVISDLRTLCWVLVTRVAIRNDLHFRRWRSSEKQSSDETRDAAVCTIKATITDLRWNMETEPTRETVLEYINEVYAYWEKEKEYPEHASAVVRLINEQPDIVDAVLASGY